jgi:hypothetical protein
VHDLHLPDIHESLYTGLFIDDFPLDTDHLEHYSWNRRVFHIKDESRPALSRRICEWFCNYFGIP